MNSVNKPIIIFDPEHTPEEVAEALGIPVIAEIEPRPDPVYGHIFTCPEEVVQLFASSPASAGEDRGGG